MAEAEQKKAKTYRKRLNTTIIKLVKPPAMGIDEYRINCEMRGFKPEVENGMFLHWIMTAQDVDESGVADKVRRLVVRALRKGYLLETGNDLQASYFCDALQDAVPSDRDYATALIEAFFDHCGSGPTFDFVRTFNKTFGFTDSYYFSETERHLDFAATSRTSRPSSFTAQNTPGTRRVRSRRDLKIERNSWKTRKI